MALLPYLFDDVSPIRANNRILGLDLSDDFISDIIERPRFHLSRYTRPWGNLTALARDVGSTIKKDANKFQVNLDVHHFDPEEISVKTADGCIVIEGKHEERKDEHGFVSRQFKRRYTLPEDCNPDMVESKLSSDGVLIITAPRSSGMKNERAVPITHTGPVRRKVHEEEAIEEAENKEIPQKKRRR